MNPLRQHYESTIDRADAENARDLDIAYEALGRIEGRKRFTPSAIMCKVAVGQSVINEARQRCRSFYWPFWREEVIAEHGPALGSVKDYR